jgi:DNA-binding MarR family transcriptional regulator
MGYASELAVEFLSKMQLLVQARIDKPVNEAVQGEGFVLHYIALHSDGVLPGEIGHKMGVSTARVATALNSLEKKGLITRQIDTSDRRKILVGITLEGKCLAEKNYRAVVDVIAKRFALLGEYDAKEYVRITSRLAEMLLKVNTDVVDDDEL